MAVKACDAPAGKLAAAVFGLIEVLLWERGYEQPQTLQLLGIEYSIEQFITVHNGDDFPVRYIAKVGTGSQVNGRRKLGQ